MSYSREESNLQMVFQIVHLKCYETIIRQQVKFFSLVESDLHYSFFAFLSFSVLLSFSFFLSFFSFLSFCLSFFLLLSFNYFFSIILFVLFFFPSLFLFLPFSFFLFVALHFILLFFPSHSHLLFFLGGAPTSMSLFVFVHLPICPLRTISQELYII